MKKLLLTTLLTMSFNCFASEISTYKQAMVKPPLLVHYVEKADALDCDIKQKSEIKDFIGNCLFGNKWESDFLLYAQTFMTMEQEGFVYTIWSMPLLFTIAHILKRALSEGRRDVIDFMQEHKMLIARIDVTDFMQELEMLIAPIDVMDFMQELKMLIAPIDVIDFMQEHKMRIAPMRL